MANKTSASKFNAIEAAVGAFDAVSDAFKIRNVDRTTLSALSTTVTTQATFINVPEQADTITLIHCTPGAVVWIGADAAIEAAGTTVFPLIANTLLQLTFKKGNNNNLYGIVAADTIPLYVCGVTNE